MEECSLQVRGEVQQIFKVLTKEEQDKMPFEGIQIAKTLSRIPFFKRYFDNNSQHFINLCIAQDAIICQSGIDIYHKQQTQGRQRYLYVILEGIVQITSQDSKIKKKGVLRIFGQTQLVFGLDRRQEKVISLTQCKLMRIRQHSLLKIFAHKDSLIKCQHFLDVNPYFDVSISKHKKMQLSLGLSRKGFDRGEVLKSEGDGLQTVLFFVYGKAEVSTKLMIQKEKQYVIQFLEEMSIFGQYQCVSGSATAIKVRGIVAGAYYYMNFQQMKREEHKICQIIEERSAPYPCNEQLIFLEGVKSTLKKQENRVVKKCRLFV